MRRLLFPRHCFFLWPIGEVCSHLPYRGCFSILRYGISQFGHPSEGYLKPVVRRFLSAVIFKVCFTLEISFLHQPEKTLPHFLHGLRLFLRIRTPVQAYKTDVLEQDSVHSDFLDVPRCETDDDYSPSPCCTFQACVHLAYTSESACLH